MAAPSTGARLLGACRARERVVVAEVNQKGLVEVDLGYKRKLVC